MRLTFRAEIAVCPKSHPLARKVLKISRISGKAAQSEKVLTLSMKVLTFCLNVEALSMKVLTQSVKVEALRMNAPARKADSS
jgi:hypothetical protein